MTKIMSTGSTESNQQRPPYHSVEVIQPVGESPEQGRLRAVVNLSALPQVSEGYEKPSVAVTAVPEMDGNVGIPDIGFIARMSVMTTHLGNDSMTIHMVSADAEKLHTFGLDYIVYADLTVPRDDKLASTLLPGSTVFVTVDVKQPDPIVQEEVIETEVETDLDQSIDPE